AVVYDHLICSGFKRGYLYWKDHGVVHEAAPLVVYDHLICSGFKRGYLYWKDHGVVHEAAHLGNRREEDGIYQYDMHGLLDDLFPTLPMEGNNAYTSEGKEYTSLNTEPVKNDELSDPRVTQEIKWLARGPNNFVRRYSSVFVKGYRFHTKNHKNSLKSQNSGVVVTLLQGPTKKKEIWNLASDEKVLVTFNELCQPIGDEGNELPNFLGTLVRMPQHIGIHYPK
nr:hypothetical protein [Tanacetum cinerariifolium]